MSILTDRELEFVAGLSTQWPRLYRNELALLLAVRRGEASDTRPYRMAGAETHARLNARDRVRIVAD